MPVSWSRPNGFAGDCFDRPFAKCNILEFCLDKIAFADNSMDVTNGAPYLPPLIECSVKTCLRRGSQRLSALLHNFHSF